MISQINSQKLIENTIQNKNVFKEDLKQLIVLSFFKMGSFFHSAKAATARDQSPE